MSDGVGSIDVGSFAVAGILPHPAPVKIKTINTTIKLKQEIDRLFIILLLYLTRFAAHRKPAYLRYRVLSGATRRR